MAQKYLQQLQYIRYMGPDCHQLPPLTNQNLLYLSTVVEIQENHKMIHK